MNTPRSPLSEDELRRQLASAAELIDPQPPTRKNLNALRRRHRRTHRILRAGAPLVVAAAVAAVAITATAVAVHHRFQPRPPATHQPVPHTPQPTAPTPNSSTPTASASTAPPSRTASTTNPPTSPAASQVTSGLWTDRHLAITGNSLGGVNVGMSSTEAARAAGVSGFVEVGDGVLRPADRTQSAPLYLYLGNNAGEPASTVGGSFSCLGAALTDSGTPTQTVTTTRGLHLGDPVARVHAIYGTSASFVPMPTTGGISPHAGYVVHEGGYDLVFKLDPRNSRVIAIAGGIAPMTPSECNG
jgi:hypothetical protein